MRNARTGVASLLVLGALAPQVHAQDEAKAQGAAAETSFARDVAPMIVASCLGCHNAKSRNYDQHNLDLTSFDGLTKGGVSGPVVEAKKSATSLLIARLYGDGVRKMPPGNNNNIGEAKIKQVAAWIDAGALLDGGKSGTADVKSYAMTPEQARKEAMAALSPEQRSGVALKAGEDLYKAGNLKDAPDVVTTTNFAMFSKLPQARAKAALDLLEREYAALSALFVKKGTPPLVEAGLKISVVVFNDSTPFAEFQESQLKRKYETGKDSASKLEGNGPFLAAIDPLGGQAEPEKPKGRTKKAKKDDPPTGPTRSLAGLLAEELGVGLAAKSGKMPRYLALGVGAYSGSRVEPTSPYYNQLRTTAGEQVRSGGPQRINEALGDTLEEDALRALGFSLFEFLGSNPRTRPALPYFLQGLQAEGAAKLDDVLLQVFRSNREPFLAQWSGFIAARYGRLVR